MLASDRLGKGGCPARRAWDIRAKDDLSESTLSLHLPLSPQVPQERKTHREVSAALQVIRERLWEVLPIHLRVLASLAGATEGSGQTPDRYGPSLSNSCVSHVGEKSIHIDGKKFNYKGEVDSQGKACGRGTAIRVIDRHNKRIKTGTFFSDLIHGLCGCSLLLSNCACRCGQAGRNPNTGVGV